MKNYTFEHTPDNLPDNCGIGWLLNNSIQDKAVEGTTQNLLDFYSMKYRKIPQVASYDFVELCQKGLDDGYNSILILKQGILLNNFIEDVKEYWATQYKDCVIIGHILDRSNEDAWWQIHPQCMYIDLEWWEQAGKPFFGERNDTATTWTANNVKRSTETVGYNTNETYNPEWIVAGNDETSNTYKRTGWNLLNTALMQGKQVGVWNNKLRHQKDYVYGEMNDHHQKISAIGEEIWVSRWYAANTEDLDTKIQAQFTSTVYSTCGGLSPISNAYIQNLKVGGKLICFDADPLALHMQNYVFDNWDGTNWKQFVTEYAELNPILGKHFACMEWLDNVDDYLDSLGQPFIDWWNNKARTFDVEFLEMDIMNVENMTGHISDNSNNGITFIDSSNAFNYEVNSVLYSKNIRLACESDYLTFFKSYKGKITWKGFDINDCNADSKRPWLPKLFPWQKF